MQVWLESTCALEFGLNEVEQFWLEFHGYHVTAYAEPTQNGSCTDLRHTQMQHQTYHKGNHWHPRILVVAKGNTKLM